MEVTKRVNRLDSVTAPANSPAVQDGGRAARCVGGTASGHRHCRIPRDPEQRADSGHQVFADIGQAPCSLEGWVGSVLSALRGKAWGGFAISHVALSQILHARLQGCFCSCCASNGEFHSILRADAVETSCGSRVRNNDRQTTAHALKKQVNAKCQICNTGQARELAA